MALALAVGLFLLVLVLIITQPRGLSIGWTAAGGAILALVAGIVSVPDVITVIHIVWDATLTFVAVILISLILDAVGFFEWSALHMLRISRGRGLRVFILVGLLGALVTMFFTNDGTALILTPIVYHQAKALKLDAKATVALVMASGFIADTTSLPLVVSNLVNIVSAGYFHLGFGSYALRMLPVDAVSLAASLGVLYLFYRRALPSAVDTASLPPPASAIRDVKVFRAAWLVLGLLLAGYIASQFVHWPVAVFAGGAAIALLAVAHRSPVLSIPRLVGQAPWKIVVFSIGMYVVVFGLRNVGLTHVLGTLLTAIARRGAFVGTIGTGFEAAVLSSVMNNMPTVLINALAIHDARVGPLVHTAMAYANVVGCDLGPKFTPIGSLATLLWLHVLDRWGIRITWGYYVRAGLTLTIPVLLVTLAALWGWSLVLG